MFETFRNQFWEANLNIETAVYVCLCKTHTHTHTHIHTHTRMAQTIKETFLQCRRPEFDPWVGKIPWRKERIPTPVLLPAEFHGQRSLLGYSPWDHKDSDMTDWLQHIHALTHTHIYFNTSVSLLIFDYIFMILEQAGELKKKKKKARITRPIPDGMNQ